MLLLIYWTNGSRKTGLNKHYNFRELACWQLLIEILF